MENLEKIIEYLDDYLNIEEVDDKSWNGLQVEGSPNVEKVSFSVNAGETTIDKSIEEGANLIIVHHGLFWKKSNPSIVSWMKKRVKPLLKHEVSLYGVHLPLDMHEKVGHNATTLKRLGMKPEKNIADKIGWIGKTKPITAIKLKEKMEEILKSDCRLLDFGPKKIETVAVISGAGASRTYEAVDKNVDLLITGEEGDIYDLAKDAKISVLFGGHYATETLGLLALKDNLEKKFNIETVFIDSPTGL